LHALEALLVLDQVVGLNDDLRIGYLLRVFETTTDATPLHVFEPRVDCGGGAPSSSAFHVRVSQMLELVMEADVMHLLEGLVVLRGMRDELPHRTQMGVSPSTMGQIVNGRPSFRHPRFLGPWPFALGDRDTL
jgi:hypothetical protein